MMPQYSMICIFVPGSIWYFLLIAAGMTICPFDNVFTVAMCLTFLGYVIHFMINV